MHCNDAYGAVAELGASQHGAFTRPQATRIGLSPRDIRRLLDLRLLVEPVPGVLVFAGAPATVKQELWIATHACGGGFIAGFDAAAWLHGIDGFDQPPLVELIGAPGRRHRGIDGVVLHSGHVPKEDIVVIDGIPCTGLARTVCDIATKLGSDRCLQAIDDFERRGYSLTWLTMTATRLDRPGQSGTRIVRRLLAERTGRAPDSWFERLVERCVGIPGLPPWTRQHRVFDDFGTEIGRIDLACVALRLGVEAHSKRHHFGAGKGKDDQERDDEMAAEGWNLRYVGWYWSTRTPEQVAARIAKVAHRRAQELGVVLPWVA